MTKKKIEKEKENKFHLSEKGALAIIVGLALLFFLPFIFSNKMIYGSDAMNGLSSRIFYANFFHQFHTFPRIVSNTLSGMPTLDAFFGDILYPPVALSFIMDVHRALGFKYLLAVACAGLFGWLFLRRGLGFRQDVALLGAVAFMFNTQFISHFFPGHDGKMFVISYLPLSLFAVKRLVDTRKLFYVALLATSIGLCLLTSHVQTTYFSLWGIGLYFLYETIFALKEDKIKGRFILRVALFTFAIGLGLSLGMVQFLPPYKFTKQFSVRSTGEKTTMEHATSWSLHPEEVGSLIVPEFSGFSAKDEEQKVEYWGRNPFKLNNEYPGIVIFIIALFGLWMFFKDRFMRFWALMALGALIFALGANTPFFALFYHLVPGVKLFRAPSMIMFWFSMTLMVGAAYTLNKILTDENWVHKEGEKWGKKGMTLLMVCAGLVLVVTVAQDGVLGIWKAIFYSGMGPQQEAAFAKNYGAFIKGAWCALLFGGGALLLVSLFLKGSFKPIPLIMVLGLLILADLFRVDAYFYKLVNPSDYLNKNDPTMTSLAAQSQNDPFRVLPIPGHVGASDAQLNGLDNCLGFHDNELRWYREFTGGQERANLFYGLQQGRIDGNPFMDLLNVRYVLFRQAEQGPLQVAANPTALPRAFVVSDFELLDSSKITARLREPGFPYRSKIILEKMAPSGFVPMPDSTPAGIARYKIEQEDRHIEVEMARPGFVVVSDIYIPYWQATVDGKEALVYKADLALMAVPVPVGKHTVVLQYRSPYIALGAKISIAALALCIALFATGWCGRCSRKKEEPPKA